MGNSGAESVRASGGCLCGAVRYQVHGPLRPVVSCHCEMCRRTSGHYVAATQAKAEDLELVEDRGLKWYRSSEVARRGFCGECGGNLFWARDGAEQISIMAGTLDPPTGLETVLHICIESKSDYHALPAEVAVSEGIGHSVVIPES